MLNIPLIRAENKDQFVKAGTLLMKQHIDAAIKDHGFAVVGLSGGKTPMPVYEALAKERIDWAKVHFFLTDERCVPASDKDSNIALIKHSLLLNIDIPEANIVFPDTDLPLGDCITTYENDLKKLFLKGLPDLILFGIGEDGHIASLFPPVREDKGLDLVIHTTTETLAVRDRISLTLPVLAKAKTKLFMLTGEKKTAVWNEMLASEEGPERWPAKAILKSGDTEVLVG